MPKNNMYRPFIFWRSVPVICGNENIEAKYFGKGFRSRNK
jgi:hypothetical protein